jgi:hypothetical protein
LKIYYEHIWFAKWSCSLVYKSSVDVSDDDANAFSLIERSDDRQIQDSMQFAKRREKQGVLADLK